MAKGAGLHVMDVPLRASQWKGHGKIGDPSDYGKDGQQQMKPGVASNSWSHVEHAVLLYDVAVHHRRQLLDQWDHTESTTNLHCEREFAIARLAIKLKLWVFFLTSTPRLQNLGLTKETSQQRRGMLAP